MLVDGKTIAKEILDQVARDVAPSSTAPRLTAITCAPNFETQKYLEMKKQKASAVGINLNVVELPADVSTEEVIKCVERVAEESDGVVVQLPFPAQVNRDMVLEAIPPEKDPDGFKYGQVEGACLSPVVGAIDEISNRYNVIWSDKRVVIIGEGRLVGIPSAHYAKTKGGIVDVLTKENFSKAKLSDADIIVTGIGQPHLIGEDLVKEGVIIFDAGTSEDGGVLVGDVSPEVGNKASLLTPVPGGIGPITIAYLLRNLVSLVRQ
ncbi:bifunctional 5,10-methylenetetrahydrofolate dehydrogenase/5,10-methenyltetrahydrofolate cyclohydrolase [Candidatus Kaiserbacteria bacterium]|nr:bifunctional 5,10-methylenetetrahydrofolate dehydrogenase/5,10-methenyltetrahydrofolate cyclohydrolase [Candidatus Kaiserbacteria bacterium]